MLIDEFLPQYDFVETHDIVIRADVKTVYQSVWEVDVCESWITRWLLFFRGLESRKVTLQDLKKSRFELLDQIADRELVIGLVGRFWSLGGDLQKIDAESFKQFNRKGFAKAVWNFTITEESGKSILTTETRIKCLDEKSLKSFRFYWNFIQPFSGLIRMEMLKLVKLKAEAH